MSIHHCCLLCLLLLLLLLQAHRHRQTLRAALLGWVECVQLRRRQRQLLLRAEACHVFMTLLRVLQQWRAHTTDKQVARLRAARWVEMLCEWCVMSRHAVNAHSPTALLCLPACSATDCCVRYVH